MNTKLLKGQEKALGNTIQKLILSMHWTRLKTSKGICLLTSKQAKY